MVIAGAADPDAARAALDLRFGPSSVATSLAPLRTAPEARRVLRMAPRAVPGIAQTPRVIVGWSQRAPGGLSGQVADLHIELVLRSALLHDPRVASVGCGHQDVLFNRTFTCTIALLDDDTVNAIAGELPAILEDLDPARAEGRLLEFVSIQAGLWGLVAFQQHVAGTGSFATWRARTLLEGVSIDEPKEDLRRWARESMLAETALILALPGGATPRADFPRPEPVAEGAPSEAAPVALPPPTPALVTAHRILQNGLELVAVQRPDAVLLHQALAAQAPQDPSVARAIHGVIDNQKLDPYIIDVGAGNGTTRYRQVAMIPGFPLAAAERLLGGIRSLGWQP